MSLYSHPLALAHQLITWFLKVTFVLNVGMCVYASVSAHKAIITTQNIIKQVLTTTFQPLAWHQCLINACQRKQSNAVLAIHFITDTISRLEDISMQQARVLHKGPSINTYLYKDDTGLKSNEAVKQTDCCNCLNIGIDAISHQKKVCSQRSKKWYPSVIRK